MCLIKYHLTRTLDSPPSHELAQRKILSSLNAAKHCCKVCIPYSSQEERNLVVAGKDKTRRKVVSYSMTSKPDYSFDQVLLATAGGH